MKQLLPYSKSILSWILIVPTLAWCYIGLFLTMIVWYPAGLPTQAWQAHLFHFTIIYLLWMIVFFSYRLFDWDTLRSTQSFLGRLLSALFLSLVIAALYFYFQPTLLITPRRFLIVHMLFSGVGILAWYTLIRQIVPKARRREVYVHNLHTQPEEVQSLIENHQVLGLKFAGPLSVTSAIPSGSIVVVPTRAELSQADSRALFNLRNRGVRYIEYHELYEGLTRTVHLSVLTDLWFVHSIDYSTHQLFDAIKRLIDIGFGLLGTIVFVVSWPVVGLLIKLTSPGPILFTQLRVGQNGRAFRLYKYRTMGASTPSDTWTQPIDARITSFGKILRSLRVDELPQSLNILIGNMSIVGPRPEQVGIVERLREQLPYYDERHSVKPGLTGWAQLHVYAGSLEETRVKLQYDLYYIKHRSLLFDLEIIVKTFYNVITFSGR
jgi:lipopolysaccharide/colanic/teichoic acid biosynthesis glycosyltransferase